MGLSWRVGQGGGGIVSPCKARNTIFAVSREARVKGFCPLPLFFLVRKHRKSMHFRNVIRPYISPGPFFSGEVGKRTWERGCGQIHRNCAGESK